MKKLLMATMTTALSLACAAADLPKQGDDSYTTEYVVTLAKPMKLADRTAVLVEFSGISRNDKGAGLFHRFGVRCFGVNESGSPAAVSRGVCTDVDPDGDQIFSSYETRVVDGRTAGVHTFTGGTGKYAGFSGKAEFSVVPVKSADGSALMSVPHKASWRLP